MVKTPCTGESVGGFMESVLNGLLSWSYDRGSYVCTIKLYGAIHGSHSGAIGPNSHISDSAGLTDLAA